MILLSIVESQGEAANKLIKRWALAADYEHASRKKKSSSEHNSLLARAVLRSLLNRSVEILTGENGKPYIKDGPYISLSHSKNMVACAVAEDFAVGVDIEFHEKRDFAKLSSYAFGPEEIRQVSLKGVGEFYRIWTMREAVAKISGASIFTGMDGKDIDLNRWQMFSQTYSKDYSLALAIENKGVLLADVLKLVDVTPEI